MDVSFSVNDFDKDGDLFEEGIYLHLDGLRIRVAENMEEYIAFVSSLKRMEPEIAEIYNESN